MIRSVRLFIALVVLVGTSALAGPELKKVIWVCSIPCARASTGETLKMIHPSMCSTSVLSPAMIESMTPVCRTTNNTDDAVALRWSARMLEPADCSTSGETCTEEGLVHVAYSCRVICPGESPFPRIFATCASSNEEAWSAANQVCPNPEMSDVIPVNSVCEASGEASCLP